MRHRRNLDRLMLFMVCRSLLLANKDINSEEAGKLAIKKMEYIKKGMDFDKCEKFYIKANEE